jgi:4-hydroxythreonine-4-phosphate dehydrogenase
MRAESRSLPVALTMGDACGIGPEIIAKLFRGRRAGCFVLGDVAVMRGLRAAALGGGMLTGGRASSSPSDALQLPPNCVPVLQVDGLPPTCSRRRSAGSTRAPAPPPRVHRRGGRLARAGEIAAIVTAPIHKEALAAAGVPYPGHTEMLQALAAPPAAAAGAHDAGQRRAAHGAGDDPPVAAPRDRRGHLRRGAETLRIAHRSAARWGQPRRASRSRG